MYALGKEGKLRLLIQGEGMQKWGLEIEGLVKYLLKSVEMLLLILVPSFLDSRKGVA